MSDRLNIIYIVCHDLGKLLGCYDVPIKTPNLDRFSEEGIKFTNAFCASPCCSPSRGCAVTGKYAHNNGMIGLSHFGWGLPESQRTVVDYFNDNGYMTAHVGFQHERHWQKNRFQIDRQKCWEDEFAENAIDAAVEFLKDRPNPGKPFYLNIGVEEVHACLYNRESRLAVYGGPVPESEVFLPNHFPDTEVSRITMSRQIASIKYLDTQLERLFKTIEELGYYKNTMVLFTTDHGISGPRAKGTLYDRGTEVSLLMKMPKGYKNGIVVDHVISNIDVAPTLMEASGIEIPEEMQGRSFWSLLRGETYTPNEEIYIERNYHGEADEKGQFYDKFDPVRCVRTKKYHYIRNFNPRLSEIWDFEKNQLKDAKEIDILGHEPTHHKAEEELYDVEKDPDELSNLAYDEKYAEIKKELSLKLHRWMVNTNDFVLEGKVKEPHGPKGFFEEG